MNEKLNEVLKTVDFYYEVIENPENLETMDANYMNKMFQACVYIENAIKTIQTEKKEEEFESHLNAWMSKKKKSIQYKCANLINACDKMLEFCLKQEKIPTEVIDELLKKYIHHCGSLRLETTIYHILSNSMQTNVIFQSFKNLKFPESDIENEILLSSWKHEINIGKGKKVKEYVIDMFNKKEISRLIDIAYKSETNSKVNVLILELFAKKLSDNNILLCSELKNTKKDVLLKLLKDNPKFQDNFIDATFYIGRSMERNDEDEWISEIGFFYSDLMYLIRVLLSGPEEVYKLTLDRIKLGKELDAIWEDIEKDCVL